VTTMIERDANIPPLAVLESELMAARQLAERTIAEPPYNMSRGSASPQRLSAAP
jgi:uncharacterized protein (UPF0276 family)